MSFYSRQLLSNPTLRTFWQSAYIPTLKKQDVLQAGSHIGQCVDALKELLAGKDWAAVTATLQAMAPSPTKRRGTRHAVQKAHENETALEEPPLIMMALRLPSYLLLGMVRVHSRLLLYLQEDAQHTLHALGLATTEAVHTVTPPTQRRTLVGRKRKQMEDFPGQGKTLDDEVDLHDIDITLPEFEGFLLQFPPFHHATAPLASARTISSSAAGDVSASAYPPPFQAQLEAVPKEQAPPPAMPYREDLEGDEVFEEAAGPELEELMGPPEPLLPRDTLIGTPPLPPTPCLFPHTPGAPRGPLLPPDLATSTTATTRTSSSHIYDGYGQADWSSYRRRTEMRTFIGSPKGMTLPDTQEAQDFAVAQVTLPDAAGVGLPAYPRPDLVTPSVSAAAPAPAKADVGAVQKEPVSSEELIPFEQGPGHEDTFAYAAGDQVAYEEDAEGGVQVPGFRVGAGLRSWSEAAEETSTDEFEPGEGGADRSPRAAAAVGAAEAGAKGVWGGPPAELACMEKEEMGRVEQEQVEEEEQERVQRQLPRAVSKRLFKTPLRSLQVDGLDATETIIHKREYRSWTLTSKPLIRKRPVGGGRPESASRILLSTPQTLPAAATTVLDPVLAVTAVEAAAKAGRLVDLLGRPQPSLHTTGLPKELLPPGAGARVAAGRAQPAQQQRAHASHALAGLSAWALASDEQGRQPGTGTALAEDLQALYRYAVQGPPAPSLPPTPSRPTPVKPPAGPPTPVPREAARRPLLLEEEDREEMREAARQACSELLQQSSLAEESGASVESAARVGQQQREHGSIAYEQPAVFQDEYEMMMDSQKPLQLPEAQAAHDQQRLRHHAAQLPMNKEVQMLAYQRLPHRTRAAAGMLHAAFKGLQAQHLPKKAGAEDLVLDLDTLVIGKSRLSAARWFTDAIALQGCGLLQLDQDHSHQGPIFMRPSSVLMQAARN